MSDLYCVLSRTGECIANVSMACLCRQMLETIHRAELRRVRGPPCDHSAWKGISVHGRCCPECGHFMVDFGD